MKSQNNKLLKISAHYLEKKNVLLLKIFLGMLVIKTLKTKISYFWNSNTVFVILICFHLTNCFGEEKFSWLSFRNKVADEKTHQPLCSPTKCQMEAYTLGLAQGYKSPRRIG